MIMSPTISSSEQGPHRADGRGPGGAGDAGRLRLHRARRGQRGQRPDAAPGRLNIIINDY